MTESYSQRDGRITPRQRELIDGFASTLQPDSAEHVALLDQAVAELRDNLADMELEITTERDYYAACVVALSVLTTVQDQFERGVPFEATRLMTEMTFAALRPDSMR